MSACPIPGQGKTSCSVPDQVLQSGVLVWCKSLAFDGDLASRGFLLGLLVKVEVEGVLMPLVRAPQSGNLGYPR